MARLLYLDIANIVALSSAFLNILCENTFNLLTPKCAHSHLTLVNFVSRICNRYEVNDAFMASTSYRRQL